MFPANQSIDALPFLPDTGLPAALRKGEPGKQGLLVAAKGELEPAPAAKDNHLPSFPVPKPRRVRSLPRFPTSVPPAPEADIWLPALPHHPTIKPETRWSRVKAFFGGVVDTLDYMVLGVAILLVSSPAYAQVAGLDGLAQKIQQFNGGLVTIGGALAVSGFVWGIASLALGLAGASRAIVCLVAGLAMASAPQIVGFFTGVGA